MSMDETLAFIPEFISDEFIGPKWVPVIRSIEERNALVAAWLESAECFAARHNDVTRAIQMANRRRDVMDILCMEAVRRERAILLREARMVQRMTEAETAKLR